VSERPSSGGARPLSSVKSVPPVRAAAVWGFVSLGVLLGAALPGWPYENACGSGVLLYPSAVAPGRIAGLWGARVSGKGRVGGAAVVAVLTIIWGLALTAQEVLPREPIFYAKTRLAWRCRDSHAAAPSVTPFSVAIRLVEAEPADRSR